MDIKEIQISVPWGHVAVKIWGDQNDIIVLCFHGIMDNAASFDRLLPLLVKGYCFMSVDLPGHGKSSHFPPHLPLYIIDYLIVYKLITDYFEKNKYIILGHSLGGQLALMFTQLYPERVTKLIMLDTVHMLTVPTNNFKDYLIKRINTYFIVEEKLKRNKPKYTYEEALERVRKLRRYGEITEEAAEPLVVRNTEKTEDGKYVFTVDQRLRNAMFPFINTNYAIENLKKNPVLCPVLIILGNGNGSQKLTLRKDILNFYKDYRNFKIVTVDGNHDVHNVHPERVAPHLNEFLMNSKSKL